jgi:hypothetical protein
METKFFLPPIRLGMNVPSKAKELIDRTLLEAERSKWIEGSRPAFSGIPVAPRPTLKSRFLLDF